MSEARIHSRDGSETVAFCEGPDWNGACPKVRPGDKVLCADKVITAAGPPGVLGIALLVDPEATKCPLAAFGPLFLRKNPDGSADQDES
jgi:hypothetical protein